MARRCPASSAPALRCEGRAGRLVDASTDGTGRMGLLAQAISASKRAASVDSRRAAAIEEDVCRRLGIEHDDERLGRLQVAISRVAGGRRSVEVVEIREPEAKRPLAMYGTKKAHGSEPWSAEKASALGLGPAVLDVSEDGLVLEEFFPEHANIRHRRPTSEEFGHYSRHLSSFFVAFIRVAEGELICHKDPRPEHIFIVGEGEGIQVKLIDWGRASVWPFDRFPEWARLQFFWFYQYLSFHEPAIWRAFADSLVEGFPEKPGRDALAAAYGEFVSDQTGPLGRSVRRRVGTRFLEFIVRCGRLALNAAWLNEFVEKHEGLSGEELARAYDGLANASGKLSR